MLNQYAVYQLKANPDLQHLQLKPYQYFLENHISVVSDHYRQVFQTLLTNPVSAEELRRQLVKELPSGFMGDPLRVSDVIVVTKDGISTAFYVDDDRLIVIPGFFRVNSSAALITMDTEGFYIEGRKGNWMAADEIMIDGRQFFLMSSEEYGRNAAFAVVDANGIQVAKDSEKGFDDETIRQIRERMKSSISEKDLVQDKAADQAHAGKPKLENWQKYLENGEYLRSSEMADEQNYNMIDGVSNNRSSAKSKKLVAGPDGRISVLERLKEKQAVVDARYGRAVQERTIDDMQRNRK